MPSGVSKVKVVNGDSSENCLHLRRAGGFGINGKVDPQEDYTYAPMFRVALGLAARYNRYKHTKLFNKDDWDRVYDKFVTADKSNGDCAVVDFRTMLDYMVHVEGYYMAGVCDAPQ